MLRKAFFAQRDSGHKVKRIIKNSRKMHTRQYICKNTIEREEIDILTEQKGIFFCLLDVHMKERKKEKIMHFCSAVAQAHAIKRLDI